MSQSARRRGEASLAQVNLQNAPPSWTYERRPSVKLAKSQLRTVRISSENPSLEPKVRHPEQYEKELRTRSILEH